MPFWIHYSFSTGPNSVLFGRFGQCTLDGTIVWPTRRWDGLGVLRSLAGLCRHTALCMSVGLQMFHDCCRCLQFQFPLCIFWIHLYCYLSSCQFCPFKIDSEVSFFVPIFICPFLIARLIQYTVGNACACYLHAFNNSFYLCPSQMPGPFDRH